MTTLLQDTFTGTGALTSHSADVSVLGAWVQTGGNPVTLSGGNLTIPLGGAADVKVGNTTLPSGYSDVFTFTFTFTTPASLSTDDEFAFTVETSGASVNVYLYKFDPDPWTLDFGAGGTSYSTDISAVLSVSTTYTGTVTCDGSDATLSLLGLSPTVSFVPTTTTGTGSVSLLLSSNFLVGQVELTGTANPPASVYVNDLFGGSGSAVGSYPSVSFLTGAWASESGDQPQLVSGKLVGPTGASGYAIVSLGNGVADYGLGRDISVAFDFITPATLAGWAGLFIELTVSGKTYWARVVKGTTWDLAIHSVLYDPGDTADLTGSISPSSTYPGVFTVASSGEASVTLCGSTLSLFDSPPGTPGINMLRVGVGDGYGLGYIEVSGNAYTAPAITGSASILIPPLTVIARPMNSAAISIPALTISAKSGGIASITVPKLTVSSASGAFSEITLPSITSFALGHDSTGEQAISVTLPSLAVTATLGGTAKLSLPKLSAAAAATGTVWGSAEATLPSLTASADGRTSAVATADIALPAFTSKSYSGAVCSITIDNKITVAASLITGGVASAQVTLPLFEATATATANAHGSAAITLPSLAMGTTSRTAATLPSLTLTAIGSATITATYEAYAINLGHRPRVTNQEIPINEVTHYTNFPFTHVVRYKNSYYGANSTGLYLLEGTTDAGTAIPWAVKTAMDDFKTPVKKTVAAAYFGGRFGPASTVQLHAGEDTPNTYSYSTPRDALAQNHRLVFGKGVKERYFALGASGTGTCELDTIELETHNLSRRI